MDDRRLAILKFGGSVLADRSSLGSVVEECRRIAEPGRRVIAVVSAYKGVTDRLAEDWVNRSPADRPDQTRALASGEFQTAADLQAALESGGLRSRTADLAEIGLRAEGDPLDADPVALDVGAVEAHFGNLEGRGDREGRKDLDVLVVPGFVALDADGGLMLLGRGGSDLTAIHLACHLRPEGCDLIKDVDGLYATDPARSPRTEPRYRRLTFDDATSIVGRVIQRKALDLARISNLEFRVRSIGETTGTVVGGGPTEVDSPSPREDFS